MATSYGELLVELLTIQSDLPDRDVIDWAYCDFYNKALNTFADQVADKTVLFYRITDAHLKAFRPSPQLEIVYICPRQNFLAELNKAIEYCEKHLETE